MLVVTDHRYINFPSDKKDQNAPPPLLKKEKGTRMKKQQCKEKNGLLLFT